MITKLTRRFKRRALARRNLTYYAWRFVANAAQTYRAISTRAAHSDAAAIGRELLEQGIVVGRADRFLSEAGRAAMVDASRAIQRTSQSDEVQAIVSGAAASSGSKKDFLVNLVGIPKAFRPTTLF